MVLWQVRGSVCTAFESCPRLLLKIAVSPAVHFCFERGKPDLLSGLNAEEKNKCGNMVEKKVVRRGGKLWIKVSSLIPGKRNQLFEVMTHAEGAFGCE